MSLNIGNQFSDGRSAIDYGKVPLWDRVDEQYPSGVFIKKEETDGKKEGTLIPAGTPVQVARIGDESPKIGSAATAPTGLTRYDAVMGSAGCTLTVVTRGAIYIDRVQVTAENLTEAHKTALAGRILFIKEIQDGDV